MNISDEPTDPNRRRREMNDAEAGSSSSVVPLTPAPADPVDPTVRLTRSVTRRMCLRHLNLDLLSSRAPARNQTPVNQSNVAPVNQSDNQNKNNVATVMQENDAAADNQNHTPRVPAANPVNGDAANNHNQTPPVPAEKPVNDPAAVVHTKEVELNDLLQDVALKMKDEDKIITAFVSRRFNSYEGKMKKLQEISTYLRSANWSPLLVLLIFISSRMLFVGWTGTVPRYCL